MTLNETELFETSAEFAALLDAGDALRPYRKRFHIPLDEAGREVVYFTGNSLGLQPKTAREYIDQELDDWARLGVEGHLHAKHPWLPYHEFVTEPMARVVGALPIETVVMNSLTVNLHLLMVSFYRPTPERYKIIIEKGAFPSDQYAVESQILFHETYNKLKFVEPALIELAPREGETTLRAEDIIETIDREGDSVALILLGGVNYYTGQAFDMQAIAEAGHRKGCVVGFDCAHAAGNLALKLHDWNVDFAAWCSYKETRFLMGPEFRPLPGAEGWQISNPPIFQLAALRASLEIFDAAGMPALREKSEKLTGYLEFLIDRVDDERISVITPRDPEQRGCQLSMRVRNADKNLFDSITKNGIAVDWREPDVIRVAPAPLYNSFADVFRFVTILRDCLR